MADKNKTKLIDELRALDEKQLNERLAAARKTLVEHRRSLAAQELPSSAVIRKTRREVAVALTVLGEKRRSTPKKEEEK
jgi:ribosomal protein L29